jgi:hypothetical protein
MRLAAPAPVCRGDLGAAGRWYLATGPSFLRLKDADDVEVQFVLLPYPTVTRYIGKGALHFSSIDEKKRALHAAVLRRLGEIQAHRKFSPALPCVVAAHAFVHGAVVPNRFRISEMEDIAFRADEIPINSDYVALGHLHRPQYLRGTFHVRYSGSIERLDMGEREDSKQVVVVEIGRRGRVSEPISLPLAATTFYDISITNPERELPQLRQLYPEAAQALVRYQVKYAAGRDDLNEILAELNRIFPRWYDRSWSRSGSEGITRGRKVSGNAPVSQGDPLVPTASFRDTVIQYVGHELVGRVERDAVLRLAEEELADESG